MRCGPLWVVLRSDASENALRRGVHGDDERRRQAHGDRGAEARPAGDLERAAVQLDQAAADRQAEAGAAVLARERVLDLVEGLADPRQLVRRDADAAVRYGDGEAAALLEPRVERDGAALGRELDRVGQEIEQDLLDRARIGLDRRQVVVDGRA